MRSTCARDHIIAFFYSLCAIIFRITKPPPSIITTEQWFHKETDTHLLTLLQLDGIVKLFLRFHVS